MADVSLTESVIAASIGVGLIGLTLWQDYRERRNDRARLEQERMRLWRRLGEGK